MVQIRYYSLISDVTVISRSVDDLVGIIVGIQCGILENNPIRANAINTSFLE